MGGLSRLGVGVAAVALLGASAWALVDHLDPPQTHVIQVGYVFDVDHFTDYRVSVQEVLKADVAEPEITVRQHGVRDAGWAGEDTYVVYDQPLLEPGQYVLALTEGAGPVWTVLGGPLSAKPLPSGAEERADVLVSWQRAIEHQRMPEV